MWYVKHHFAKLEAIFSLAEENPLCFPSACVWLEDEEPTVVMA